MYFANSIKDEILIIFPLEHPLERHAHVVFGPSRRRADARTKFSFGNFTSCILFSTFLTEQTETRGYFNSGKLLLLIPFVERINFI